MMDMNLKIEAAVNLNRVVSKRGTSSIRPWLSLVNENRKD
jgi:hypothetical protein